jgi:hypothetical protein
VLERRDSDPDDPEVFMAAQEQTGIQSVNITKKELPQQRINDTQVIASNSSMTSPSSPIKKVEEADQVPQVIMDPLLPYFPD